MEGSGLAAVGWGFADRAVRGALNLVSAIVVARALGPEGNGLLASLLALSMLSWTCATAGLDQILVRELVRRPAERAAILGSALALRLAGAVVGILAVLGVAWLLRGSAPGAGEALLVALMLGGCAVCTAFDVVDLAAQAAMRPGPTARVRMAAGIACTGARIAFALHGAGLLAIVATFLIEAALVAAGYLWAGRGDRLWRPQVRLPELRVLLDSGLPMLAGAGATVLLLRSDQVVLAELAGDHAAGQYAAGLRLVEPFYIPAIVLATALFPRVVAAGTADRIYRMLALPCLVVAAVLCWAAAPLVAAVYGPGWDEAAHCLAILAWVLPAYALGAVLERALVAAGDPAAAALRVVAGLAVGATLWPVLVAHWGAEGCAMATVAAQWSAVLATLAWPRHRREAWRALTAALRPGWTR